MTTATTTATTTAPAAFDWKTDLRRCLDSEIREQIEEIQAWITWARRSRLATPSAIRRQEELLEDFRAELRRRADLPRGERLAEQARQAAMVARELAEDAELEGDQGKATAAGAMAKRAERLLALADRVWARESRV